MSKPSQIAGWSLFVLSAIGVLSSPVAPGALPVIASESRSKIIQRIQSELKSPVSETLLEQYKSELDAIIAKKPDFLAYRVRSTVRFNLKDADGAMSDINKAIELNPKDAASFYQRGMDFCLKRQAEQALADLTKAIELGEQSGGVFLFRALSELQLGKSELAIADFSSTIESEHDSTLGMLAVTLRSQAYLASGQYDLAIKEANSILAYQGKNLPERALSDAHKVKGTALFNQRKFKEGAMELRLSLAGSGDKGAGASRMVIAVPGDNRSPAAQKVVGSAVTELGTAQSLGFSGVGRPPADRPVTLDANRLGALAPYVEKARKSLPEVKERYRKGLPSGYSLSVTTRIYDLENHQMEQVFVLVTKWQGESIEGKLSNKPQLKNYSLGQQMTVPEADVLDWTIVGPDGREEGNFVGKYLDTTH